MINNVKKIKDILNTYTDEELETLDIWINSNDSISNILIDKNSIDLITVDAKIKINDFITKEGE